MVNRVKYSRTFNLPWSQSESSDDVWWKHCRLFEGKRVVVTEKLDGECTTIYPDGFTHARSLDTAHHPSRSWLKQFASNFAHEIPEGYRVCGENVFAWHSIFYTDLPSYFFAYGIYDNQNICLHWEQIEEMCQLLGVETVPVIYRGEWDEEKVKSLWAGKGKFPTFATSKDYPSFPQDFSPCEAEGYVIRLEKEFPYEEFRTSCAKYVRANHVTTPQNWMMRPVVPNLLKS